MITFRAYRGGDETQLVDGWNRAAPLDRINVNRFLHLTVLEPNFDHRGLVEARDDAERLAGFVYATTAQRGPSDGCGWISALAVSPEHRRRGIGRRLLERAERHLCARGCGRVVLLGYPPAYHCPGIDPDRYPGAQEFMESSGYRVASHAVGMDRSLVGYERPEAVRWLRSRSEAQGWTFRTATPADFAGLLELAGRLATDWPDVVRAALVRAGSGEQVKVAVSADGVAGFAMFGAYRGFPDRFGPFGVDPRCRGTGLGAVLLHECLEEMAARGVHSAWFLWTDEEAAAGRLYRRTGFAVTQRFSIFEKSLP